MASTCEICHKGPGFGKAVSHSHRRTNRRWDPNIQSIRVALKPGKVRKLHVCTSCIKSGKVQRPSISISS